MPARPNFFLAGVPKAGTTAIYHYLRQHPQIFLSGIKEPVYFGAADLFAEPYRAETLRYMVSDAAARRAYLAGPQQPGAQYAMLDWDEYLELFRDVRDEPAVGEASVGYFWLPSAAGAIHAAIPHARLLFVLRDPAELLRAAWLRDVWRKSPLLSFRTWFFAAQRSPYPWMPPLGRCRLAANLERWFERFPRGQIRTYLYDDFRADPHAVLRDIFTFLGVRPDHPIDMSRRHNETVVARFAWLHAVRRRWRLGWVTSWVPDPGRRWLKRLYERPGTDIELAPADRALVAAYVRDDILRAGDLIGRDLSRWLS